jgi:Zinc knuckle
LKDSEPRRSYLNPLDMNTRTRFVTAPQPRRSGPHWRTNLPTSPVRTSSVLRHCCAKSTRTLKTSIHSLPSSTSLLHKPVMQSQTPYVDWTLSTSILHSLEYSDIPGEDWGMFPTRIGHKYLTANPHQIYADARVYYSSHFVRKRLEQGTSAAIAAASIKPIPVGLDEDSPPVLAIDNRNDRDNRTMRGHGRGRGGRGLQRKEYPTDPDGYCTFHRRAGHTTKQSRAHLQPPTTDIQCYNCNKVGHESPDCPERNRYAPSSVPPTPPPREPPILLKIYTNGLSHTHYLRKNDGYIYRSATFLQHLPSLHSSHAYLSSSRTFHFNIFNHRRHRGSA